MSSSLSRQTYGYRTAGCRLPPFRKSSGKRILMKKYKRKCKTGQQSGSQEPDCRPVCRLERSLSRPGICRRVPGFKWFKACSLLCVCIHFLSEISDCHSCQTIPDIRDYYSIEIFLTETLPSAAKILSPETVFFGVTTAVY